MNLKAHVPIIALCGLTFLVSFAAGLWWEIARQDEWDTQDTQQSIAKRKADTEKPNPDQDGQADTNTKNVAANEKDRPDGTAENSENQQETAMSESSVMANVAPTTAPSNALSAPGGVKRLDRKSKSPNQRTPKEKSKRAMKFKPAKADKEALKVEKSAMKKFKKLSNTPSDNLKIKPTVDKAAKKAANNKKKENKKEAKSGTAPKIKGKPKTKNATTKKK